MYARLQDCELSPDNEVTGSGNLVHFALISESDFMKIEEEMSDSKWICAMKEELGLIERNKKWGLVDLTQGLVMYFY